jgi:transposase-like protein
MNTDCPKCKSNETFIFSENTFKHYSIYEILFVCKECKSAFVSNFKMTFNETKVDENAKVEFDYNGSVSIWWSGE